MRPIQTERQNAPRIDVQWYVRVNQVSVVFETAIETGLFSAIPYYSVQEAFDTGCSRIISAGFSWSSGGKVL